MYRSPGDSLYKGQIITSFDDFFDKLLKKQSSCFEFVSPSSACDVTLLSISYVFCHGFDSLYLHILICCTYFYREWRYVARMGYHKYVFNTIYNAYGKVLGIHIDNKLKFDKDISELCKRASRHLNAISRVSKFLDEKCRISLYHSFILSHFHYCNIVWHNCDTENTIKIEKIQKRALRVILNDYQSSYDELLDKIDQPLMYISRLRNIVLETFKSVNKINTSFMQDLFEVKENKYNLRGGILLDQPKVRTERYGIHTIRYQGALLWNSLPPHMKTSVTVEDLKYHLA